ncbi:uncharacterized protein [Scyliorhinus torazame]|uniref:uncharacterized protein isoform X1 n=1 Tax=Scyliorhinus torazame TaxID=75743 RepID=UPI003B5C57D5
MNWSLVFQIQDVLYDIQKIYYPFLVAVGVPINLLTIVILSKGKCGLSKGTTCYLVAMAAADMLVAILDSMLRQIPILYWRQFSFLCLSKVGLKGSCAQDLVFAFSRNQSVTYLNLDTNSFRDQSVPALCNLIQTSKSLKRIVLMWNQFSPDGKNQLKSLQESRPGLSVAV